MHDENLQYLNVVKSIQSTQCYKIHNNLLSSLSLLSLSFYSLESYACVGAWSAAYHSVHPAGHPHTMQRPHYRNSQATIIKLQTLESLLHHVRPEVC